jgi:hypothetical protein
MLYLFGCVALFAIAFYAWILAVTAGQADARVEQMWSDRKEM